jgi:Fe-S-cluster containining protein
MPLPDCTTCGGCCAFSYDWPEFTDESDLQMEGIPLELCDVEHGRMKCAGDRCLALTGEVGRQVSCSVYPNRPNVCRAFEPGSDDCNQVRRYFKLTT